MEDEFVEDMDDDSDEGWVRERGVMDSGKPGSHVELELENEDDEQILEDN